MAQSYLNAAKVTALHSADGYICTIDILYDKSNPRSSEAERLDINHWPIDFNPLDHILFLLETKLIKETPTK